MSGAKAGFSALLRDARGNVLPLAAVGLILSAALVGGGIDMSRAYRAENRLQSACDAAALAGRRAVGSNGFDTTANDKAENYFDTNFDPSRLEAKGTTRSFSSPDNGQTVVGTAGANLDLAVMKIFGFPGFALSVSCQASMGVGNSDVVMVLDTTGSMSSSLGGGTRISALRTAMKNFYTTVKTATQGTNARIRYGFVPFSSSVNVGHLLYDLNPNYLVDTYSIQSREAVKKWKTVDSDTEQEYRNDTTTEPELYSSSSYNGKNSCERNFARSTSWEDDGSDYDLPPNTVTDGQGRQITTTTNVQPQKRTIYLCLENESEDKWYRYKRYNTRDDYTYKTTTSVRVFDYWNYRQISYDVSAYKAFQSVSTDTGSSGSTVWSTWQGCIEERDSDSASSFSYSTITGITPYTHDLDLDSAPTSDPDTQWAPMWPEVAYLRQNDWGGLTNAQPTRNGTKAGSYCPYKAQLLASMTQSEFDAYADALYPEGSTYLDIGMVWGGRLSSPQGIFADTVNTKPSNGGEVSRHLIFMSDGQMEPSNTIQSAWGIEYHDRRVTDNGSSNDASRHTSRFLALCEAIKAKGIRIWTISFTTGTSSDLQTCASPDSYFNADDATALNAAFQEIAKQVGELRITQ